VAILYVRRGDGVADASQQMFVWVLWRVTRGTAFS